MTDQIVYASPPMRIGKHEWRVVVYLHPLHGRVTRYEWKKPDFRCGSYIVAEGWRDYHDWPSYDLNDGMYSGLPKTLHKLWDRYQPHIEAALGIEPAQASMVFEP